MEKMKLKIDYSVYLVTDTGFLQGRDFAACIEAALKGGVTLLQYRDKNADSRVLLERALLLKKMCAVYHVPLLINDRLDIALAVQADGVHVGQSDLPVTVVRRLLGEQAVIGASAHNPEEARQALADGADYLGCGAVFGTTTKNDAGYLGLDGLQSIRHSFPTRHLLSVSEASTAPILNRYCKPVSTAQLLSAGFWQQMILKQRYVNSKQ